MQAQQPLLHTRVYAPYGLDRSQPCQGRRDRDERPELLVLASALWVEIKQSVLVIELGGSEVENRTHPASVFAASTR